MVTVADMRMLAQTNLMLANRDLAELFSAYAGADPRELRDAVLEFYPDFVRVYGDQGAALAADFYDEARSAARASGSYRAGVAPAVSEAQAVGSARWAIGPAFADDWDLALQQLVGASSRLIQQGARDTIRWNVDRDPYAVGWRRETRADSCQFCRMLADRGGVYTKETAYFASHDRCQCVVAPSWNPKAPRARVPNFIQSKRMATMSDEELAEHRLRVKVWFAENANRIT